MEKQEEAFRKLKEKFINEPVLATLDLDKKMRIEVDASYYTTGEVLSWKMETGDIFIRIIDRDREEL